MAISLFSGYYTGFFNSFVIIAGIISFIYIIIHIVSNISLIKLFNKRKFAIPFLSSLILAIAFLLSFYGNNGYFAAINYFLIGYVVISFLIVLFIRKTRRGFYDAIRFEYYSLRNKLPETNKD
ncbi:MAG TPA: hypothetical protein HA269_07700 [Ferroplasma sp.]|nr:hypothetical protein [Ferroplasma sp.]